MKVSSAEQASLRRLQANLQQAHQNVWAYHWSMKGVGFLANHPFLDDPLEEIDEMVDWVAERLVQVGGVPVNSYDEVLTLANMGSVTSQMYSMEDALKGIENSLNSLDSAMLDARQNLDDVDTATSSQLDSYIGTIEKYLWMIQSAE